MFASKFISAMVVVSIVGTSALLPQHFPNTTSTTNYETSTTLSDLPTSSFAISSALGTSWSVTAPSTVSLSSATPTSTIVPSTAIATPTSTLTSTPTPATICDDSDSRTNRLFGTNDNDCVEEPTTWFEEWTSTPLDRSGDITLTSAGSRRLQVPCIFRLFTWMM